MPLLVALLFLAHGFIGLERLIFANELLCILGIVALAAQPLKKNRRITKIEASILLFILYGSVHIVIGFTTNESASIYEKSRTLPILYSTICFFTGYHLLLYGIRALKNSKIYHAFFLSFISLGILFGPKIFLPAIISISIKSQNNQKNLYKAVFLYSTFGIIAKTFLIGDYNNDMTAIALLSSLALYIIFTKKIRSFFSKNSTLFLVPAMFIASIIFIKAIGVIWNDFYYYGYEYFSFTQDPNTIWRLMFWAKTINELEAHQWFFGIGLGTPIFDINDPLSSFIYAFNQQKLHLPYTLGLHNSFLTFFVRFGLIGIIFLLSIILIALRLLSKIDDMESHAIFVAILMVTIASLFNVIIESALFSGLFWAIIGCAYKKTHEKPIN